MYNDNEFVSSFLEDIGSIFAVPLLFLYGISLIVNILSGYPTKKQIIFCEQSILADVTMEGGFTLDGLLNDENAVIKLYLENSSVPIYVGTIKDGRVSNNNMLTDLTPGTYTCKAEIIKNYVKDNEVVFMIPEIMTLTVY